MNRLLINVPSCPKSSGDAHPAVTKSLCGVACTLVVNTRKYDIHHRYVAHVVYAFNNRGIEHT